MASVERFEDIEAWVQARILAKQVYCVTSNGTWSKDIGLRDQIRRASVSVMSNIAEGFARNGDAEFLQFLTIARGSLAEVKSQLYLAGDLGYVDDTTFASISASIDKSASLIAGLMRYLKP